eukprot:1699993-Lingulodinium_polyedra.AAC.1
MTSTWPSHGCQVAINLPARGHQIVANWLSRGREILILWPLIGHQRPVDGTVARCAFEKGHWRVRCVLPEL